MKTMIIGLAVSILYALFLIFQWDNNLYLLKMEELKAVATECAAAATLYYDLDAFKNGEKIFNREEGNKAIKYLLKKNLKLNEMLSPDSDGYWVDPIDYYVFYFDDSELMYYYHKEERINTKRFTYGEVFTDPVEGYKKAITQPTVIVTIVAGCPNYRLSFLKQLEIQSARSSAYGYEERK